MNISTDWNKKDQVKCPHCGSRNTARILYGKPAMNDELQAELDSGKVRLGGCCVSGIEDGNGDMIRLEPSRYCNDCQKEFSFPPFLVAKDQSKAEAYNEIVKEIRFTVDGYLPGESVVIKKNEKGALVSASKFLSDEIPDRQITKARWDKLVERLYVDFYLHEWQKKYDDSGVTDLEHWKLEILMTNRRKQTYEGNHAYPPYWSELKALFRPFFKRSKNC